MYWTHSSHEVWVSLICRGVTRRRGRESRWTLVRGSRSQSQLVASWMSDLGQGPLPLCACTCRQNSGGELSSPVQPCTRNNRVLGCACTWPPERVWVCPWAHLSPDSLLASPPGSVAPALGSMSPLPAPCPEEGSCSGSSEDAEPTGPSGLAEGRQGGQSRVGVRSQGAHLLGG